MYDLFLVIISVSGLIARLYGHVASRIFLFPRWKEFAWLVLVDLQQSLKYLLPLVAISVFLLDEFFPSYSFSMFFSLLTLFTPSVFLLIILVLSIRLLFLRTSVRHWDKVMDKSCGPMKTYPRTASLILMEDNKRAPI